MTTTPLRIIGLELRGYVECIPPVILTAPQADSLCRRRHVLAIKGATFISSGSGTFLTLVHSRVTKSGTLYQETHSTEIYTPKNVATAVALLEATDAWKKHLGHWNALKAIVAFRDIGDYGQ